MITKILVEKMERCIAIEIWQVANTIFQMMSLKTDVQQNYLPGSITVHIDGHVKFGDLLGREGAGAGLAAHDLHHLGRHCTTTTNLLGLQPEPSATLIAALV